MFASGDAVVLGDSVNVAARLEQAAQPGEVLIGEETYRLVRDAVQVEPVAPIAAKGKAEPLTAYPVARGERARADAAPRGHAARRARGEELARLGAEFAAAAEGCRLVTVVGEAGVGKSRLTAELAAAIGDRARIVRGACLSYGEGITYWPIAQIVRELAGIRDEDTAEQGRERVPPRIAQMLGLTEGTVTSEQIAEAIAELVVEAARAQPLVLLIDDIHWAEPALLDLIEQLPAGDRGPRPTALSRQARAARRPARLAGHDRGSSLSVPQRSTRCSRAFMRRRRAASGLRYAAAGNPLYAEELVAWVREGGDVDDLPTSLNALLGARLDRLRPGSGTHSSAAPSRASSSTESAVDELSGKTGRGRARPALPQGHDPARGREPRRRVGRVSLQAHPRSRRGLPRHHQEAPRDAARAATPTGSSDTPAIASASTTRSSAITSRRRTDTAPSSEMRMRRSRRAPPAISAREASEPSNARTIAPRRTWPSERSPSCRRRMASTRVSCASTDKRSTSSGGRRRPARSSRT